MKKLLHVLVSSFFISANVQTAIEKDALKLNLNESGTHYFQATFLNQTWIRFNESNTGTLVNGLSKANTFDIGLRRTRMQLFGQLNDRVFVYFQFGQNNFNSQYNLTGNRKQAAFVHDAVCEYRAGKDNTLKLGAGLTITNGLSRFSQPSIGTIMTMDVPVFAQATVDQTDQFSRKLSLYARGQIGKFDYRLVLSDPFPITSNGATAPALGNNSSFALLGHSLQQQGYLMYQFFDHESHTTPYMAGSYLGKKKVFNIAAGAVFQKNAMWHKESGDTIYQNMLLWAVESFLDMPLNKEKGTTINAYVGYFNTNYGANYLRYNGIMNPASSTSSLNVISGAGSVYGNSLPMFGTGSVIYSQIGFLLPKDILKSGQLLLPYASATLAKYDRLGGLTTNSFNAGINWLINGHKSKITLDWANRPTYKTSGTTLLADSRKNCVTVQYQIFF